MEVVWTILGMLAWIAVMGGIAYLIFAWIRRGRTTETPAGIGVPRRFYFYWISFVALMMLASGILVTFSTLLDESVRRPGHVEVGDDEAGDRPCPRHRWSASLGTFIGDSSSGPPPLSRSSAIRYSDPSTCTRHLASPWVSWPSAGSV